jgi:cell division protein FtsA
MSWDVDGKIRTRFDESELRRALINLVDNGLAACLSAGRAEMVELGEEIFHMPVRVGVPKYSGGLADVVRSPRYATAVGLLLEGVQQLRQGQLSRQDGSMRAVLSRMREWFQRNF